jgi:hypothetical protein
MYWKLNILIKGKSTDYPLKFRVIFNSATDVSIFTMYPPKVLISLNVGTFNFFFQNALNSDSGQP